MLVCFTVDSITEVEELEDTVMESSIQLNRNAYIAGDTIKGTLNIKSTNSQELTSVDIKLIGKGTTQYFKAKLRAEKLCEILVPISSVKESCIEPKKVWSIPFSIKLEDSLPSTIDSGKKGRVTYFISWEMKFGDAAKYKEYTEMTVLANHPLDSLPRRLEMTGNNQDDEEFDSMQLGIYSPASAYLPGEIIQFQTKVKNLGKKTVKKIAVLLLQNVLFYKSAQDSKGRTRSFLMTVKEKSLQLKTDQVDQWRNEIQLPDPVPPSAEVFHRIDYEIVLVAITKGKKSNIRALFDQARYHFDLEKYQDDYFRDFLPHACCYFSVGSHHGNKRSASLNGAPPILPINDIWKQSTKQKKQRRKLPKPSSQANLQTNLVGLVPPPTARITFKP